MVVFVSGLYWLESTLLRIAVSKFACLLLYKGITVNYAQIHVQPFLVKLEALNYEVHHREVFV